MLRFGLTPAGFALGRRNVHYSWVIVGVASMMWMTSSGMRFAASLLVDEFNKPEYFGWSIGAITLGFTIQWLVSGALAPVSGWLGDRYGVRRVMWAGGILFIAGMVLTGAMTHLWEFYLYFGLILAAGMAAFQVTLVSGVTLWFRKQLGLAMGILQALQGMGTAGAILMVFILFEAFGLRWTFWIPGVLGGALLMFLVRFFHNEPAAIGLRQWGAPDDEPIRKMQNNEVAKVRTKVFLKQAQKTSAFWNLVGIHFWGCAAHNIILILLVAMVTFAGHSKGTAVAVYLTLTVVSTITRFAVPVLADRFGARTIMKLCFSAQTFPLLLLLVNQDVSTFFIFAALFGFGMGGEMTAFPIINRQYYGDAPTGTTYGWQMAGAGVGMAIGPILGGFLKDWTDTYTWSVLLSFGLSFTAVVSIFFLPATDHHQLPDWEDALPEEARGTAGASGIAAAPAAEGSDD
ncbi:MAG: MFS transporter [Chloroflexi bacterium]|nr:MFS transporter [Chloroflexota bacterium]MDA1271749.1 MFS transporter [Chloroflexota bacterium]